MFTQAGSFEAELFNREGELWPEADVTLVDLGIWRVRATRRRWP